MIQVVVNNTENYNINIQDQEVSVNESGIRTDIRKQDNGLISILMHNQSYEAQLIEIDTKQKRIKLRIQGKDIEVQLKESIDILLSKMGMDLSAFQKTEPIKAPMPGMILKVLVEEGQVVQKGDGLVILEAMKMENVLKATAPGTVKVIKIQENTAVEKGNILIEME